MPTDKPTADPRRRTPQSTGNRGRLAHGLCFVGTVESSDPSSQLYTVVVESGEIVENVVYALPFFCGLLGIKVSMRLTVGSRVLLAYGNPAYIFASIPADFPDKTSWLSRTMTGTGVPGAQANAHAASGDDKVIPPHNAPEDLYDGELEIGTLTGGFIRLLMFMSSIGGSERAKIEFHLLRDLVRVVSQNYEHFSSSGDFKIFEDGRANMELNGTTYEHERWGAVTRNSPRATLPGTGMPVEPVDPQDTGRWRYTFLLGFLGDLFNGWFSDPCTAAGKMAEEALRSGKARFHVGQDGTILVQSCAEVAVERVTRILVPIRLKHEEDPEGVLRKEMDELDREFLAQWDSGGEKSEHHTLYKVREYVRYLNQYQSLARIHQLAAKKQEWKVPSEDATPAPKIGAGEEDREAANSGLVYWKECYSTRRIMRDGSILDYDAYGQCICTGPSGIHISSTRHIYQYASGDYIVKAGGSVFLSAKHHVEVAAHRGSLILKARTGWRALCERGTLFLKSDYDPDNAYSPESGDPEAEIIEEQGIRIQATRSQSRWISYLKARFVVTKSEEALELSSVADINVFAGRDLVAAARRDFTLSAVRALKTVCSEWLVKSARGMLIDGVAHLARGTIKFNNVLVRTLKAVSSIAGPERLGSVKFPSPTPFRPHTNHIGVYEHEGEFEIATTDVARPEFPDADPKVLWRLLPESAYRWTGTSAHGKSDVDALFEPLAQQHLRLDNPDGYMSWSGMADALLAGPETASGTAWPAKNPKWLSHNPTGPPLNQPTNRAASSFKASIQSALTSTGINFKVLSR